MAVETVYGEFVRSKRQTTPRGQADKGHFDQRIRNLYEKVSFTATASVGSKGYIGALPSNAIIDPRSEIFFGAAGAGVTLNIGDSNDEDGLATAIDISSAGKSELLEAVAEGNMIRRLWEHLGYSADPGGEIDLYVTTAGAGASGAFDVVAAIGWTI